MIDTRVYPARHSLAGLPIAPLGYRASGLPIWPILGAADDDDDSGDGKDDDDDSGDGKDDDDPWAGKTDAELKAELARLSSAHTTAKKQAKSWREKFQGKASDDDADDDDDSDDDTKTKPKAKPTISRAQVKAAEKAAEEKARNELMPVLVASAAESLLTAAGMVMPKDPEQRAAKVRRAVRNMDLEDVELVDGRLVGVDDAVAAFKAEYAELFGKATVRTPRVGNASGSKGGDGKAKTVTELQAEALFGGKD
jgi:hypothetical protein